MTERGEVVRVVRVFVSSPGDVKDARAVLDEVVRRINDTTGFDKRVRLEHREGIPRRAEEVGQAWRALAPLLLRRRTGQSEPARPGAIRQGARIS